VNLSAALFLGAGRPGTLTLITAAAVGFIGYGVSLTLLVRALRHIGTARTGAYFSLAPFVGVAVSIILLRDGLTVNFLAAATLMSVGVWLHLTERHEHEHRHEAFTHEHTHVHDEHHRHGHDAPVPPTEPHRNPALHFHFDLFPL
jgi:hypothetical protein